MAWGGAGVTEHLVVPHTTAMWKVVCCLGVRWEGGESLFLSQIYILGDGWIESSPAEKDVKVLVDENWT